MEVKDGDDSDNAAEDKVVELISKAIERVIDKKFSFLEKLSKQIDKLSIVEPSIKESEKKDDKSKEKKSADAVEGVQVVNTVAKPEIKEMKEDKKVKETPPQKTVALSYKINCVSDVSVVSSTFEIDVKIFTYWTDEKLIGRKNGSFIDYEKEKGLFEPDIIVTNEFQLNVVDKDSNTKIIDSKTGEIKRTTHYKGTVFLGSMDLKLFPFDCQNLQICFKPYKLPVKELRLVPKVCECAIDRSIMHEWNVLGHCVKIFNTDPETSSTLKSYSTLFVTILARRKYHWHLTNVYLPTAAFLVISWLVFFYSVDSRAERIDICIATLLASISNKYVIGDHIPKVDYRTLLDTYLDFCFYLQLSTFVSTVLLHMCRREPWLAYSLNISVFVVEFVVAAVFHEWMWVRLRNHEMNVEHWIESAEDTMAAFAAEEEAASGKGSSATGDVAQPSPNSNASASVLFSAMSSPRVRANSMRRSTSSSSASILMKQKLESSLMRFLRALIRNPEEHFDDGSLKTAISSSDHFIHFGANQISKKSLNVIESFLEQSFDHARAKTEQEKEVVQAFQFETARSNYEKTMLTVAEGGLNYAASQKLRRELNARRVQGWWRHMCSKKSLRAHSARKIWKCYLRYKLRKDLKTS